MASSSAVGLALAVTSAATFATSGPCADALIAAGWSPPAATLVRIVLAALLLTVPALHALHALRGRWSVLRVHAATIAIYGVAAIVGAQLCFFEAITHLSVGVALLLEYSGILLVVLWMWTRHAQRPSRLTLVGGVTALVGLVLVLGIVEGADVDAIGVVWGLGAAFGLAVYYVVSSRAAAANDGDVEPLPPMVLAWGGMVVGSVLLAVLVALGALPWDVTSSPVRFRSAQLSWALPVAGMSLLAAAIAYSAGIAAGRRLGARVASFVGLAEVLFAIVFAWLLLGQRPSAVQLVGAFVVVVGIALVRAGEPAVAVAQPDEPSPHEILRAG